MAFLLIGLAIVFGLLLSRHSRQQKQLQDRLAQLEFKVDSLQNQQRFSTNSPTPDNTPIDPSVEIDISSRPAENLPAQDSASLAQKESPQSIKATSREPNRLIENMKDNWMLWLGGFCVALSGVFLAKYSIEQGLLSPSARISLGAIVGLILLGVSEWLRRKKVHIHHSLH